MELISEKYKKTDLGLIPEDWNLKSIESITKNIIDYRGVTPKKLGMEWGNGTIVALSAGNVKKGYIDFNSECYLGSEELYRRWMRNGDPQKNDIAFTLEAPLGNIALIPDNKKYILSQRTILLQIDRTNFSAFYVFQYLISTSFQNYISATATGSTAQGIKRKTFETLTIAAPSNLAEQNSIANALSDTDNLIKGLEIFIDKKRSIKKGAMQKLLQVKEGWAVKKLGEIAEVRDGTHQTPKYVKTGIPFYSVETVTNNSFDNTKFISEEEHKLLTKTFKIEKGDILMTRIGSIGDCKLIDWEVNASFYVSLALLKIKSGFSPNYICHYSKTDKFKKEADINSLQYAIPKKINLGPISNIKIELPDFQEQSRIANILSDMDNEILALETKLEKYKKLRLGMSQNLLTGKIRLI